MIVYRCKVCGVQSRLEGEAPPCACPTTERIVGAWIGPEESRVYQLNTYQELALETAQYPKTAKVLYPLLALAGEAGEAANVLKKIVRERGLTPVYTEADKERIADELGDCLWYIAAAARDIGMNLSRIAGMNVQKLAKRRAAGTITGGER